MSQETNISWTHATINFWWGCDEVSPACAHCYAREWAKFVSKNLFGSVVEWGRGKPRAQRLEAARAEALKLNRYAEKSGQRLRVFANSMSDWLDEEVPIEWLASLLETIHLTPWLDWQLLTKRPENWETRLRHVAVYLQGRGAHLSDAVWHMVHAWLPWNGLVSNTPPENIWIGTTVEDQTRADERIPALLKIPARVRFLSCEPLLGPFQISQFFHACTSKDDPLIDWVICGGESGKGSNIRPMHPDWARSLRDQCAAAGVAFHFKQWGEWAPDIAKAGGDLGGDMRRGIVRHLYNGREPDGCFRKGDVHMRRVGKAAAGRLLDGVEHNAFPEQRERSISNA